MPRLVATERNVADREAAIRAPRFIGREPEMAALVRTLTGGPSVTLVEGEAGIGKTRLVREFLASPPGRRTSTLVACCPPFRQPHTLGPLVDAIRKRSGDVRRLRLSELAGALRPMFPEWTIILPPLPGPLEDATATRHRVFCALAELLEGLGVRLLVLEDAHWADDATLEFLLFLTATQPSKLSLLLTSRPEDVPDGSLFPRLSRLAAGSAGVRLALGPLDVPETRRLVSSMLADGPVSDQFAVFLHERTEGLPLAVEESVRLIGDRADLAFRHGAWARRPLTEIEVPPTVRDAVLERAARLNAGALAVLRAAAVLGEQTAEVMVAAVAGLKGDEARNALCEALGCGLLIEDFPNGHGLAFRHALAARAVYEATPTPLRRDMHRRAGQVLEDVQSPPVTRLVRHFHESGDTLGWCRYAEQAADIALAAGDHNMAAALLHDVIVGADLPPRAAVRLSGKLPLNALNRYTFLDELVRSLRTVLSDPDLSTAERAEVGCQLGRLLMNAGEYEAGAAELERAIPDLTDRPAEAARAMIMLGIPYTAHRSVMEHRRWLDRGYAAAQDPSIPMYDRLMLYINRVSILLQLGEEAGWRADAELPTDVSEPRQALQIARGLANSAGAAMLWGRHLDEARQRLKTALQMLQQRDYPRLHDWVMALLAQLDWYTGAWAGLADKVAILAEFDEPAIRLKGLLIGGMLAAATKSQQIAEENLRLVVEDELRRGDVIALVEAAAALAGLRLSVGEPGDALVITDHPMRIVTTKNTWLWATDVAPARVQALIAVGRTAEAAKLITAFAGGLRGRNAPAPKASLLLCRAFLMEASGEHRRAASAFGRASAAWQTLPRPYNALLARERQARCLLTAGQRDDALTLLSEIRNGLDTLGAGTDARRITSVLREHGVAVRRGWHGGSRGYGDQLSPRELEVVRLIVGGRTSREIGERLCRSPKTVDSQLKSAMRKLGAPSRTALAVRASELGIARGGEE